MNLFTEEIRKALPHLYSTKRTFDPVAHAKFFTPWTNWTWHVTEFDGEDTFFGLVVGFEKEFGYFSLSELESIRGPRSLKIERDLDFTPTRLNELTGTD